MLMGVNDMICCIFLNFIMFTDFYLPNIFLQFAVEFFYFFMNISKVEKAPKHYVLAPFR